MTLLVLEGFEGAGATTGNGTVTSMRNYLTARYASTSFATGPHVEAGWGGGQAMSWGDGGNTDNNRIDLDLPSTIGTVYIGFAVRPSKDDLRAEVKLFQTILQSSGRDLVDMRIVNNNAILFYQDTFNKMADSEVPNALKRNVWSYVEVKIIHSATVGVIEVRINGTEVLNITNQNTSASGDVTIDRIRMSGGEGTGANNPEFQWLTDDWYVDDAAFHGPIKVEGLFPAAEGATINFTPSTGLDNALNVDDNARDDDTTYNSSADTASNKDLLTADNLSIVDGGIIAVQVSNVCRIDAVGDIGMQSIVAEGTPTQGTGAIVEVDDQVNWASVKHIFETNPDTAAAWAVAEVDGMEIGYEVD